MATRGTQELSAFLADWVDPHLRAAGFRKSHHTYRRTVSNRDSAALQFRGYALGVLGSFLLDVWVTSEPVWDLRHVHPDGTPPVPARPHTFDAAFHWQQGSTAPTARGNPGGPWQYDSVAERDQVGHHLRDLLLGRLLPDLDALLDRGEVLRRIRAGVTVPGLHQRDGGDVVAALTVTDGSPEEVDELVRTSTDRRFLAWAHARLLDGPTWQVDDTAR